MAIVVVVTNLTLALTTLDLLSSLRGIFLHASESARPVLMFDVFRFIFMLPPKDLKHVNLAMFRSVANSPTVASTTPSIVQLTIEDTTAAAATTVMTERSFAVIRVSTIVSKTRGLVNTDVTLRRTPVMVSLTHVCLPHRIRETGQHLWQLAAETSGPLPPIAGAVPLTRLMPRAPSAPR